MTPLETVVLSLYFFVLTILAVYGWHRYYLVYLYMRHKDDAPRMDLPQLEPLPRVTIQLPIYNEMYVVDRLVDAVCRIDYPEGTARHPGPGRLHRRDHGRVASWRSAAGPRRGSTSTTCTARTAPASRPGRSTRG